MSRLRGSALLRGFDPAPVVQRTTYFDTRRARLRKAGLTLRLRAANGRVVQTVKADGPAGVLFDRAEWESVVAGPAIDAGALAGTPVAAILSAKRALRPLFCAEVTRRAWDIVEEDGAVELILDEGRITAGDARDTICEIELELKAGSPALLFALARSIDAAVPIRIGIRSKSERGFRMLDGADGGPAKAEPVRIDAAMRADQACQAIMWNCIRQFRANEPLLLRSGDPDALHQARVALRRLRSALSLFTPVIAGPEAESIRGELRWIAGLLGTARDLDVFIALHVGADEQDRRATLLRQRDAAFARAVAGLESSRFRTLMIEIARWITIGAWREGDAAAVPVGEVAAATLDRVRRKLKRAGGGDLSALDDEGRHEVRIIAKKLRYGSEFFAALYADAKPRRARDAFLRALVALQDSLGSLNDLATARSLGGRPSTGDDAADHAENRARLIAKAQAELIRLIDARPYWR